MAIKWFGVRVSDAHPDRGMLVTVFFTGDGDVIVMAAERLPRVLLVVDIFSLCVKYKKEGEMCMQSSLTECLFCYNVVC